MESFISRYPERFTADQGKDFISALEACEQNGHTHESHMQYGNDKTIRQDVAIMFDDHVPQLAQKMHGILQPCLHQYVEQWPGARSLKLVSTAVKVQRTKPGGGYHVFHCECSDYAYCTRQLVWLAYLNDDYEGGETEFLNQSLRIKPEVGTVVIWPAAFPWQHRGNPPLSGVKYIATGWWHVYPDVR